MQPNESNVKLGQHKDDTFKKNNGINKDQEKISFEIYPEFTWVGGYLPTQLYIKINLDIKTGNLSAKTYDEHQPHHQFIKSGGKKPKTEWKNHGIVVNLKKKYPELYMKLLDKEINQTDQIESELRKLFYKEINKKLKYPLFDQDSNPGQKDIWTKGSKEEMIQDLTYIINQDENVKTVQEWPIVIKMHYKTLKHKEIFYRIFNPGDLKLSSKTHQKIENALKKYAFKGYSYQRKQHYSQRAYDFMKTVNVTYLHIHKQNIHQIIDAKIRENI